MNALKGRTPGETEFHQAVQEVAESVIPFIQEHSVYRDAKILERMVEPDRVVSFRITWVMIQAKQVNRGTAFSSTTRLDPQGASGSTRP